jgi:hypothetical protein
MFDFIEEINFLEIEIGSNFGSMVAHHSVNRRGIEFGSRFCPEISTKFLIPNVIFAADCLSPSLRQGYLKAPEKGLFQFCLPTSLPPYLTEPIMDPGDTSPAFSTPHPSTAVTRMLQMSLPVMSQQTGDVSGLN